jgi:membrane protease YdiL (CAAX protease family)
VIYLFGGLAVAAVSVALAAAAGGPYLSLDALNPWLAVFAVGLFVALFATPFAIHRGLGGLLEADARWERALLWWGAVSLGVLGLGLLCGLPSGFDSDSLAGSIGLVAVVEAAMVLATLVVWLVSG